MDLHSIWFIFIALLFTILFLLEGFDFGTGILLPFMGSDDRERRSVINTIGPFWLGNEVWLVSAGGAMFAAFPGWYASLLSGFYPLFLLMLLSLIFRGAAFEFRSKFSNPALKRVSEWIIFGGSLVPALLWGVILSNFISGVPVDASGNYTGALSNLLNPFALAGGAASALTFTLYGALFLSLKTSGRVKERAIGIAKKLWAPATLSLMVCIACSVTVTSIKPGILPLLSLLSLAPVIVLLQKNRSGVAFIMTALAIIFTALAIFTNLYPRVLVSNLNPAWSLTIYNASSSEYTLGILTVVALIFTPLVIIAQCLSYRLFRERVATDSELEY
ncbi:cytochrome d ubiquinol oxidase subunit II [Chlorobium sp. KB01]|uniref:cytochrome d ubiquinol oxidase subunit II n=1 Tax=Chlorobium sp. KB01 TaxID=1917528 RepID=UPI0009783944|nr:cytochrome d ubiquinol oxidase subunit II [Chlorobium sp. KB01]